MRLLVLGLPLAASLAAGCANDATVTYMIRDADPAVAVYAIQTFEVDEDGTSAGASFAWGAPGEPLVMPHEFGAGFDPAPPPFRLCAVARGASDDVLLSAVSPLVELAVGREVSVDIMLEPAVDGEIPDPCGPHVEPWPNGD